MILIQFKHFENVIKKYRAINNALMLWPPESSCQNNRFRSLLGYTACSVKLRPQRHPHPYSLLSLYIQASLKPKEYHCIAARVCSQCGSQKLSTFRCSLKHILIKKAINKTLHTPALRAKLVAAHH